MPGIGVWDNSKPCVGRAGIRLLQELTDVTSYEVFYSGLRLSAILVYCQPEIHLDLYLVGDIGAYLCYGESNESHSNIHRLMPEHTSKPFSRRGCGAYNGA